MKKMLLVFVVLWKVLYGFAGLMSEAGAYKETIDGIEWTFMVTNGESVVGTGRGTAVSLETTGAISIPTMLGGRAVTGIGDFAFLDCDKLESVTIPEGVKRIGGGAFYDCDNITTLEIPSTVIEIGDRACASCSSLIAICVSARNMSYKSEDGVLFNKNGTILIQYPGGKGGPYVVPAGVAVIGNYAFYQSEAVSSIIVPPGVLEIGASAFMTCSSLSLLTIPSSVTNLGERALSSSLKNEGEVCFDGAPPMGIADAQICTEAVIRYNVAYEDEWQYVIEQCGFTNASPYSSKPSGTDNSPVVKVDFDANGGVCDPCTLYYATNGTYAEFPVAYCQGHSVLGWLSYSVHKMTLVGYRSITITEGGITSQTLTPCYVSELEGVDAGWVKEGDPVSREIRHVRIIWAANRYSVRFNANGGTGLMDDQLFSYGEAKSLRGCSYVREGHEFVGWSRAGMAECFEDGAVVSNLTSEADDVVTLHAKWRALGDSPAILSNVVSVVSTNVVVHYVLSSVQPNIAVPISSDTGFVTVITEVKAFGVVSVPAEWQNNYPSFTNKYGSDFGKALMKKSGKKDGAGNDMLVWQDFVAGTDPTDVNDKFTASITIVEGVPVVSYTPELTAEQKALRTYKIYGKKQLQDSVWTDITYLNGEGTKPYNFFKATVEMK